MKKRIIYFLILFVGIALQTSVLPLLCHRCTTGDIVLAIVLVGVILDGFAGFLWWAILAGVLYDLVSFYPIGTHALVYLLVVYFVSFFSRRFSVEMKATGVALFGIFIFVATFISRAIVAFVNLDGTFSMDQFLKLFGGPREVILQLLANAILFFICFIVFRKIKKFYILD